MDDFCGHLWAKLAILKWFHFTVQWFQIRDFGVQGFLNHNQMVLGFKTFFKVDPIPPLTTLAPSFPYLSFLAARRTF